MVKYLGMGCLLAMAAANLFGGEVKSTAAVQSDLKREWQKPGVCKISNVDNVLTFQNAIAGDKETFGVITDSVPLTGDCEYELTFEAKGSVRLLATLFTDPKGRIDFLSGAQLTNDWQKFTNKIKTPSDIKSAALVLFSWQQSGEASVRNLQLNLIAPQTADGNFVIMREDFSAARNWNFADWSKSGKKAGDAGIKDGKLLVLSTDKGEVGFSSQMLNLPSSDFSEMTVQIQIGASADYANNRPSIFLVFFDNTGKYLGGYWFPAASIVKEDVVDVNVSMPKDKIPAGSAKFSVCLANNFNAKSSEAPAGKLFFDNLVVSVK